MFEDLRQRLAELSDRTQAIQANAEKETRDITVEEKTELDGIFAEFSRTEEELARRQQISALQEKAAQPQARKVVPAQPTMQPVVTPNNGLQHTVISTTQEKGRNGFSHFGEFLASVKAARLHGNPDQRLIKNSASSYGSEGIGEDGGFAVPPDWRNSIMSLVDSEDSIIGMTDQQTTSSNMLVVPTDEKADWQSGGVTATWLDEVGTITQGKPKLSPLTVRANKLAGLVYLTDELLEDGASMGRYVQSKAPAAIQFAVNDALINGNGSGKPLGILNSNCLVTISKETSQAAATLLGHNVLKMWARMPAASRRRAVWMVNQDIEPQLMTMNIPIKNVAGTENVGGFPVYVPPGGLSSAPFGTLLGRPIIPTECCATVGTVGDIILADWNRYLSVVKTGGIRADVSIHVEFERDLTAFRFILRVGGQPWLSAAIARKNGSNTLSHFVALETRS
jgi:HK97 family phage major capsid protein